MNEQIILYLLSKGESAMYGLSKNIQKYFGFITKPSFGTIQPALKRLEKQGCLKSSMFYTDGGKPSCYYSITNDGKDFLIKKINEKPSYNPVQFIPCVKIKLICSDAMVAADKRALYTALKTAVISMSEKTQRMINDKANDNFIYKILLDNTVLEYKTLISLIEGLEDACCGQLG